MIFCMFIGIILVFWGKPRLGIILEVFGLLNLFGYETKYSYYAYATSCHPRFICLYVCLFIRNMFPLLLAVGKNIPIVGDLLSAFEGGDKKQDRRRRGDDDYEPRRYSSDSVETKRGAYPEF